MIKSVKNEYWFMIKGETVGYMRIVPHDDYNYCEYICIYPEYRRKGYGVKFINNFFAMVSTKPLRFSYVSDNCCGAKFWGYFMKRFDYRQIKMRTFEIYPCENWWTVL